MGAAEPRLRKNRDMTRNTPEGGLFDGLTVDLATQQNDLEEVFALRYRAYLKGNYIPKSHFELAFSVVTVYIKVTTGDDTWRTRHPASQIVKA